MNPVCAQRIWATSSASRASWRTAWNATCGSSAQAWTERSPPVCASTSWSPMKLRQVDERLRPARGEAVAILAVLAEQPGAEAERHRQPRRRQAERFPGIGGLSRSAPVSRTRRRPRPWSAGTVGDRLQPSRAAERFAGGHPGGGGRPRLQQRRPRRPAWSWRGRTRRNRCGSAPASRCRPDARPRTARSCCPAARRTSSDRQFALGAAVGRAPRHKPAPAAATSPAVASESPRREARDLPSSCRFIASPPLSVFTSSST